MGSCEHSGTNGKATSTPITLTATSDTNETIKVFSVDVSPPFAVQWPGPTPIPLSPGASLPLPFTFRPTTPGVQSQTINLRDVNGEVLLTATLSGEGLPTYNISGRVTAGGLPLKGVLVTLSGSQSASRVTDDNGNYSFTVTAEGDYTVSPSEHYAFTPQVATFDNLSANQTAGFAATDNRHSINGRITNSIGEALPGTALMFSGSRIVTASADADGNYTFANLQEGGQLHRQAESLRLHVYRSE